MLINSANWSYNLLKIKLQEENNEFQERIQGDIYGPIHPSYGPYLHILFGVDRCINLLVRCDLIKRNVAYAKLLAEIMLLRAQFEDCPIRKIKLDNVREFTSRTFNDYCMSIGIDVEHLVAHV